METIGDNSPSRPLWTLFFEGTLYKRYQEYLQTHDLTKILESNGSTVGGTPSYTELPVLNQETDWLPTYDIKNDLPIMTHDMAQVIQSSPSKFLSEVEKKRRNRRTVGCIVLGIISLAVVAAATALIMHFLVVEKHDNVLDSVPIRIPGSGTSHHNISGLDLGGETLTRTVVITTRAPPPLINTEDSSIEIFGGIFKIHEEETTTPLITHTESTKTNVVTELPEKSVITFEGRRTLITEPGEFKCTIIGLSRWKSVGVLGTSVLFPKKAPLSFTLNNDNTYSQYKNNSQISVEYSIRENLEKTGYQDIEMRVIYANTTCEDQSTFSCWYEWNNGMKFVEYADFKLERKPESQVTLKLPVQIIEGMPLSISASWKSGYPEPWGNLTWKKGVNGVETDLENIKGFEISGTLKTNQKLCVTVIDSFIKFVPNLTLNDTEIIASPSLSRTPEPPVSPAKEVLYVVPDTYCDGYSNTTKIPHPNDCTKFVQCLPDQMRVYACPPNSCFYTNANQCDEL